MAEIIHLRCRYCGEVLNRQQEPYCDPCNLALCYRAMPILLGMLLTGHLTAPLARSGLVAARASGPGHPLPYRHLRYILD